MIHWDGMAAGVAIGAALLLASHFRPQSKTWVREWAFPLTGLLGWLVLLVCFADIGAFGGVMVAKRAWPNASAFELRLTAGLGAVAGIYIAAIGSQVIANLANAAQSKPLEKIRWTRTLRSRKPKA